MSENPYTITTLENRIEDLQKRLEDVERWIIKHPYSLGERDAEKEKLKAVCRQIYANLCAHERDERYSVCYPMWKALDEIKRLFL